MKANVFTSVIVALFLFVTNSLVVKADSDALLYHNVEKQDNVVSTTYFKGDGKSENLIPFKKKVNTMNEQGLCVSKVTYIWNSVEKNWSPVDKMDYTYNGATVASVTRHSWNEKTRNWGEAQHISYTQNEENLSAK
ncbi:DUF3836 domain-containing protein [Dysgonomonas macrotermitis]|uniref:DUF3836 domain-containing protein n=1 Tax=Dysgonomonas macrotermitis TaxID=1346286 RepID=A0A1M5BGB0_9BACT|nr:DUF3836 domain-containing protein [Dysgonomonas macrotermitis]SHF41479.1 Family of unknown function [Dysgonomonas macrotermitis]